MENSFRLKLVVLLLLIAAFLGYSATLYLSDYPEKVAPTEQAIQGKLIWQQKNCGSCHQFYGLGGHLGPDLTNATSIRTDEYIRAFLKTGTPVMPNFHLSESEMDALLAFLKYTNTTGISQPTRFKQHLDGTISLPKN